MMHCISSEHDKNSRRSRIPGSAVGEMKDRFNDRHDQQADKERRYVSKAVPYTQRTGRTREFIFSLKIFLLA